MADPNNDWLKDFERVDVPIQKAGPLIVPGKPEKPEKPVEVMETMTPEQVAAEKLDPTQIYQRNTITREIKPISGAKVPVPDPNRVMKINTALDQINSLKNISKEWFSTGVTAGKIKDIPIINIIAGQSRADLEGGLETLQGQLIQDQIAELAKSSPGGVTGMANAESEARRLASSIANLDPNQSNEKFLEGLKRAEDYFTAKLKQAGGERTPPPVGGGQEGPTVSVAPEVSIQAFGDYTGGKPGYDAQGNIVGLDYAVAGNTVYDENGKPLNLPLMGRVTEEAVQEAAPSFYEGVIKSVTGEDKATTATETLPDWVEMPELQQFFSMPTFKTAMGTVFGGSPQEIAQIVQSNFPGVKVFQDEKGNYILQSASTGQRYAIKPGIQTSDYPRIAATLGLGLLGGGGGVARTAAGEMGTQALIEGLQTGVGGTFNPADIAMAGIGGAAGAKLAEVAPAAIQAVRGMRGGGVAPARVAAASEEFAMPAPGGITMPGGRVTEVPPTATPVPTSVAPEAAGGRMFEAGETVTSRSGGAMGTSEEAIRTQRAQELPVPIELAKFQRSRNFVEQQRARELAKNNEVGGPIRERMTQQQDALRQNFDRFIEGTGSQVWENPYEQGGVIADALSTLAKRERTKMKALYSRADKAGETLEPVGYADVITFINEQTPTTREKLAPVLKAVQEEILKNDPQGTGMITLRAMEDVRKLINKVAQPGTPDYAFGKQMKELIDTSTQDAGGELYKRARDARAKYARDFENIDLVQKIFANKPGSTERYVALEKVTDRITGQNTPLDSVNHLLNLLDRAGPRGERAKRELQGAVLENIRDQAYRGITKDEAGNVVIQPAALNKIIIGLDKNGKLDAIFDRKTADLLRTVNEVAKDIVTAPPGSVNTSGTSSAVMNAIDTVATFGTTGIPVPAARILNELRKSLATRQLKKEVKRLLD